MSISSIHTVVCRPVSVKKLGAPARLSARRSRVGEWRGASTLSGARPLVFAFAKAKQKGESVEDRASPIEDQLVSVSL